MRRTALLSLAAIACTLAAPPASAAPPNDAQYAGGCHAYAYDDAGPGLNLVVGALAVAYSPTPGHNDVTITSLTCTIKINSVVLPPPYVATTVGPVAVLPPTTKPIPATMTDIIEVCEAATTVDAHFQSKSFQVCRYASTLSVPPQEVKHLVDPPLCAFLAMFAPIQFGTYLLIDTQGDVYVNGTLVYDCPPYV
ncbi:MAG TPA: hypothetical protein VNA20_04435 [Frankiaceae bacterium]|nr:hypothetical protein [Frankiaceae bacterium]